MTPSVAPWPGDHGNSRACSGAGARAQGSQGEQLDGPQLDGPQLDGLQLDDPQLDDPQLDDPQLDDPQLDDLRIAYLLADAGIPVGGTKGASIHVAEVCRALARRGACVLLLAQRVIASPGYGVEVVVLDPGPLPTTADGELARAAAAARFADEAIAVLTPFAPDLVYERLSLFFGQGARVAAAVGARARLVEVNAPVAAERARHFGLAHPKLAHAAETEALHDADVLAVSGPVGTWAAERGAGSVMVCGRTPGPCSCRTAGTRAGNGNRTPSGGFALGPAHEGRVAT